MFTDIEGSTRLWEENRTAMSPALKRHDEILKGHVDKHGGRVIKSTGDGILALFDGGEPLACALAIQQAFGEEKWAEEIGELRIRMGLHTGTYEERSGDIFGPDVNRAARVMDAAWGGQILITEQIRKIHTLPNGAWVEDFGGHVLKDLKETQHLYGLMHPELKQEFPPIRSISDKPNNLPRQDTEFIGRQAELTLIYKRLSRKDCRIVTVVGPGGIGKTRLGIQVSAEYIERYPHGVFFVPLAPLSSVDGIIPAIASSLKIPLQEGTSSLDQLLNYLKGKKMLFVLDNFEHLIDGAGLLREIIAGALDVQLLVTSRTRLKLKAECVYKLGPMRAPNGGSEEAAEDYEAVQLFLDYAQRSQPNFELTKDNSPYVFEILKLVSGIPLGIQLAANWVNVLSPKEIVEELKIDLDLLESDLVDMPERQRSMRGAFDYSWRQLDEKEKDALIRFSVFRGGCTTDAARGVTGASLKTLKGLVDKSLLRKNTLGRFDLHELIRQFLHEKLMAAEGLQMETLQAHSDCYLDLAASLEEDIKGKRQLVALNELDADLENIQIAWQKALVEKNDTEIEKSMEGIYLFTTFRNHFVIGRHLFETARAVWPATPSSSNPSLSSQLQLRFPEAGDDPEKFYREALRYAEKHSRPSDALYAKNQLGRHLMHFTDKFEEGYSLLEECLKSYREVKDDFCTARVLDDISFGFGYFDLEKRISYGEESLALRRRIGDRIGEAAVSTNLTVAYSWIGNYEKGFEVSEKALGIAREMHNLLNVGWHHLFQAEMKYFYGDLGGARELLAAGQKIGNEINHNDLTIQIELSCVFVDIFLKENYDEAYRHTERIYPSESPMGMHTPKALMIYGLIAAGLEEYDQVENIVKQALLFVTSLGGEDLHHTFFPPLLFPLFYHQGKYELAMEYIGAYREISIMQLYTQHWPLIGRIEEKIKAELGEDVYLDALERGRGESVATFFNHLQ